MYPFCTGAAGSRQLTGRLTGTNVSQWERTFILRTLHICKHVFLLSRSLWPVDMDLTLAGILGRKTPDAASSVEKGIPMQSIFTGLLTLQIELHISNSTGT